MIDSSRRLRVAVATILCPLTLIGCGDFAHTNPLDLEAPVTVEVTGPDSAFSSFDTLTFVAHTVPGYSPEITTWSSSGSLQLKPIWNGKFYVSGSPNTRIATATVSVEVDGRFASHVLTFVHRPTSIRASDCMTGARTASMDAFGQSRTLCLGAFDARGYEAPVGTPTVTASDPSVIEVVPTIPADIRAIGNGTSVIRFSIPGASDSVTVTVRQRIADVQLNPARCQIGYDLAVGDTVRLSPTNHGTDSNGNFIADTVRVGAAAAAMSFGFPFVSSPSVSISPSGLVTGLQAGWASVVGRATTPAEGTVSGYCGFHVH